MSKEELIDLNKMNQRDLLIHTFKEVQAIKESILHAELKQEEKVNRLELRVRYLEDHRATDKGVKMGLGLAVTIISLTALGISLLNSIG